ncbi:uncharacterized protein LOC115226398, partial [Argonauta hians]
MGERSEVFKSFVNKGDPSEWKIENCTRFFRSPILDMWDRIHVYQIKLVVYKAERAVATLVFDGQNSTITSWWSADKLITSPWIDAVPRDHKYFFIGHESSQYAFKIRIDHSGCWRDEGWLAIVAKEASCGWSKSERYPHILYSPSNTKRRFDYADSADAMEIYLKL